MSKYTEDRLGLGADQSGKKKVSGSRFEGQLFEEWVLGPVREIGDYCVIENSEFINCTVKPGEFVVHEGVVLRQVLFDHVVSSEPMTISTNAVLDHVTIRGRAATGGLWVKPDEVLDPGREARLREWAKRSTEDVDVMMDIADYWGPEATILGLPAEKVVVDPARHVTVRASWSERIDWKHLDIGPTSFWRLNLRYMRAFGVEVGIFSLPPKEDKKRDRTMQEMGRLQECGVL